MNGYADRPAPGQRAVEFVAHAAGRTVAEFQPRLDTLTYRETWARVKALANAPADGHARTKPQQTNRLSCTQTPRFSSFTAGTLRFLRGIQPVNEPCGDVER